MYTFSFLAIGNVDDERHLPWVTACFVVGLMLFYIGIDEIGYRNGQQDALKGEHKYKMQIVYDVNDTIPVDTIYVKIKD